MVVSARSLEQRIGAIEDRQEIAELLASYCYLTDAESWDELAAMFAEDAIFEGQERAVGRAEIETMMRKLPNVLESCWHRPLPPVIELEGDWARALSSFDAPAVLGGAAYVMAGRYRDELKRIDGRWVFARRVVESFYYAPLATGWGSTHGD